MSKMKITVETVQHGFALVVGNKSWLLDDEQQLAEAVVFRIGLGCVSDVSKRRIRRLLNTMAYKNGKGYESRRKGGNRKKAETRSVTIDDY